MGNSFDSKAANWDENPRRIKLVENVWNVINSQIDFKRVRAVLDYGCGTGLMGLKTIGKTETITLCDSSEGMIEQVKLKIDFYGYKNAETLKADFTTDPLPDQKFDLIISMLVLHHVEDIGLLTEKLYQLLNKGGIFCWVDLLSEDGSFHSEDEDIPHKGFSKNQINRYISEKGMETTFYTNDIFIEKEIEGKTRKYPLFVVLAKKPE